MRDGAVSGSSSDRAGRMLRVMEPAAPPPFPSSCARRGPRIVALAVGALAAGCVTEFPERETFREDARRGPADASGTVPGTDAAEVFDGPMSAPSDGASPPKPGQPDGGPTGTDATRPGVEVCNGQDDNLDGITDENGDSDCRARYVDRPICWEGACLTCVLGTNRGCHSTFTCQANEVTNICSQCRPDSNGCPGERPYCSPTALVCGPCPELAPYGNNEAAQRCHSGPFGGHCEFLFQTPENTNNTCLNLCTAVGMGCARAFAVDPSAPDDPGDTRVCRPGDEAACTEGHVGDLICDCVQ